ncbi:YceI family protein [Telluribacter sp.]|jgi:polyisoprenoid-binding protein YceI|uniref:YceI family protein n=1 Tax=Telluribacter sp. TaxID=1978767 RepID=UPI002E13E6FA|nr:YceI family protein [Telluribacter sp.]
MNKYLSIYLLLLVLSWGLPQPVLAQSKLYATAAGQTSFFSETPAENISAVNKKTQALLNTTTGELAIRITMRDFDFPNKLMQEHFNENYVESDKYPTATFRGKVNQTIDYSQNGTYPVSATGQFTVHDVSQNRTLQGQLTIKDNTLTLSSDFDVALTDHKIDVPKIVFMKIAQVIQVKARYQLTPYTRP